MTRAAYYATNTRMQKDTWQYIAHPLMRLVGYGALKAFGVKNNERALDGADIFASVAGSAAYMLNTATFQAIEAQSLDRHARKAVAAELGIDADKLKFSDYLDSKNTVVQRELADAKRVNRIRYLTDALFLVPAGMYAASVISPKYRTAYQAGRLNRMKPGENGNNTLGSILTGSFNLWDTSIYGSKAAYWMYETYRVDKTAHYEIVKLDETIEAPGKKYGPNDLVAVINRNRDDRGLTQIQEKDERNAMWPILEHLAEKMNNDQDFGVPELLYLIGLNKINMFELDEQGNEILDTEGHRKICQHSIQKTIEEIDRVADKGLDGIATETRQANEASAKIGFANSTTQMGSNIDRLRFKTATAQQRARADWVYKTTSNIKSTLLGIFGAPRQTTDYISPRDNINVPQQMP